VIKSFSHEHEEILESSNAMTYNRMEAKQIKGEHCRFCGRESVPLVKTPCCGHWICCDTQFVSLSGGGYCEYQHERFLLCYSQYSDGHKGSWQEGEACKKFWSPEEYKEYTEASINSPMSLTKT